MARNTLSRSPRDKTQFATYPRLIKVRLPQAKTRALIAKAHKREILFPSKSSVGVVLLKPSSMTLVQLHMLIHSKSRQFLLIPIIPRRRSVWCRVGLGGCIKGLPSVVMFTQSAKSSVLSSGQPTHTQKLSRIIIRFC